MPLRPNTPHRWWLEAYVLPQLVRTTSGAMRLARACLLLAAARAFAPVPPVAARTTRLHAQEEANVGTAVRNIAPWLLFVLVGPAPRPRLPPSRVDGVLDDASPVDPRRAGAAHPELQGVRLREGPRGLREPLAVAGRVIEIHMAFASTAQRPAGSSSGFTSTA